jgi:hypothetical protein
MQNCPVKKTPITGENLIIPVATDIVTCIRTDGLMSGTKHSSLQTHVIVVGRAK